MPSTRRLPPVTYVRTSPDGRTRSPTAIWSRPTYDRRAPLSTLKANASRYVPHVGKKEQARAAAR